MLHEERIRRAHQLLSQGQVEETESLLVKLVTDTASSDIEIAYLLVWCTVERNQWEEVLKRVSQPPFVDDAGAVEAWLIQGSVRRRRPCALLKLATRAYALGYPQEAVVHLQHCLRLLSERRMNIPAVRVLAHMALGALALAEGRGTDAVTHYQTALSLCAKDSAHPLLGPLYAGLCEASAKQKLFAPALAYGEQGLPKLSGIQKETLCLRLSQICTSLRNFAQAHVYEEQAWELACEADDPERIASALLQRARISYAESNVQGARYFGKQAWTVSQNTKDAALRGEIARLCGHIAEGEWYHAPDVSSLVEEAMLWYEHARSAFATPEHTADLAAVVIGQARLCEARGDADQALAHWKTAYQLGRPHEGSLLAQARAATEEVLP